MDVWLALAVLAALTLVVGFLVIGLIRQVGLLNWRIDQLAATTPSRVGHRGLQPGTSAPAFTLEDTEGEDVSLGDFPDRELLLVFLEPGCGPCNEIVPELNELQRKGDVQVLVVSNGEAETTREWAQGHGARFPVVCQEQRRLSRRYEVFATPFAFLLDEQGVIAAKGIVNSGQHIDFLLSSARRGAKAKQRRVRAGVGVG